MQPKPAHTLQFPGRRPRGRPAAGFTLLEVLVAVLILAVSLVVMLQVLAQDLKSAGISQDYSRAVLLARMKMEELLLRPAPAAAPLEGDFGGEYAWWAEFLPVPAPYGDGGALVPFELAVEVRWGSQSGPKRVRLATLRLFPAPGGSP